MAQKCEYNLNIFTDLIFLFQFKDILADLVPDDITNRLAPAEANLKWKLENEGEILKYFLPAPSKSSSFGVNILAISTMLFPLIFKIY